MGVYGITHDNSFIVAAVIRECALEVLNLCSIQTGAELNVFLDVFEVLHQ